MSTTATIAITSSVITRQWHRVPSLFHATVIVPVWLLARVLEHTVTILVPHAPEDTATIADDELRIRN